MAEELRGTQYTASTTGDTTGATILQNTASEDMHIRMVGINGVMISDAVETSVRNHIQVGKNNALNATDGDAGVKFQLWLGLGIILSGNCKDSQNRNFYLAKGQFVLEPGETLYYNNDTTGTPDTQEVTVDVWYHY